MLNRNRKPLDVTPAEWSRILEGGRIQPSSAEKASVDIIVPVYSGYQETLRCIASVLTSTNTTVYRLVLVDDCGPDAELRRRIGELADHPQVTILVMERNSGFVASCNRAMSQRNGRDVVLLNSDAEVYGNWLDRLRSACYSDDDIGTVTPLTNNGEICSYPHFIRDNFRPLEISDAELDRFASEENPGFIVDAPTGVGFCMYIRNALLDAVGLFDLVFGAGYGEENDLCQRGLAAGFRSTITADTFVTHYGGVSFGASKAKRIDNAIRLISERHPNYLAEVGDFIREDPLRPARIRLDERRLQNENIKPAVFIVTHALGGGTQKHVEELDNRLIEAGLRVVIAAPVEGDSASFALHGDVIETPNLAATSSFPLTREGLREAITAQRTGFGHVQHTIRFGNSHPSLFGGAFKAAGVPYYVTLHDYFAICPRVTMIDGSGVFCGEPAVSVCEECVAMNGSSVSVKSVPVWRKEWAAFIQGAVSTYVPDEDVAERLRRNLPQVSLSVRPHFEAAFRSSIKANKVNNPEGIVRIGIIGAIGPHKGSRILRDLAQISQLSELRIEFSLIGYSDIDEELCSYENFSVSGPYKRADLPRLIDAANIDRILLPAVWPETYSYALTEILRAGCLPVAFEIGAVANRLRRYGVGRLVPLIYAFDPVSLLDELVRPIAQDEVGEIDTFKDAAYSNFLSEYYSLEVPQGVNSGLHGDNQVRLGLASRHVFA
ncbi:glycosyltransferase [Tianweitania sp. BSSL-BM11]|uniref:Glycosyltransferase n=1 Tax=Tianweitania aestuarii TaxID=2814886 RepID=A0ABS5RRI5_9HYPH|nr:glycosyltransferase [Tianweitania aestuarii]MBS9719405.1 glycosyltransferase [Tianweitania aestuarii]